MNERRANEFRYFLESNLDGINRFFVLVCSNQDDNAKRLKVKRYYSPKGIIDNYVIITRKNFYDQPIDSDIKQHEEIGKVTTGQGEDYTSGCSLDYECNENCYRLIAVDLSRQKKIDADPTNSK